MIISNVLCMKLRKIKLQLFHTTTSINGLHASYHQAIILLASMKQQQITPFTLYKFLTNNPIYTRLAVLKGLLPNKKFLGRLKGCALGGHKPTTIATSWWVIWLERNKIIFEKKKITSRELLANIHSHKKSLGYVLQ